MCFYYRAGNRLIMGKRWLPHVVSLLMELVLDCDLCRDWRYIRVLLSLPSFVSVFFCKARHPDCSMEAHMHRGQCH